MASSSSSSRARLPGAPLQQPLATASPSWPARLQQLPSGGPQAEGLGAELLGPLCRLLWGPGGQPPPSWQQGFFFSGTPGLGTGLVQLQGEAAGRCCPAQQRQVQRL
jgi:hypothetical protein